MIEVEIEVWFVIDVQFVVLIMCGQVWIDWQVVIVLFWVQVLVVEVWFGGSFMIIKFDFDDVDCFYVIDMVQIVVVFVDFVKVCIIGQFVLVKVV